MFLKLKSKIDSLNSVSLKELDSVSLLNRVDSKYVVTFSQLEFIFQCLQENYSVLEIDGVRAFSYENNYFDTPSLLFYRDHHNGYANRIKVRSRRYVEANMSFFEIKKKENINRTNKYREKIPKILTSLNEVRKQKIQDFTRKEIDEVNLILKNNFRRITLVNKAFTERVTIDTNLTFIDDNQELNFGEIAIIEVKQSKSSIKSELTSFLKKNNIREQSISKYIYGVMLLMPNIKKNKFLPIIKKINTLNQT
jgi:hypothetical protein